MITDVKKVTVLYNQQVVGYLAELPQGIAFQYDSEWIRHGFSISPLSLPLSERVYISQKKTFDGLYGVFWDSLPDGWGELLVSRYLAKQGVNYSNLSPLTKLTLIRDNGLGGLTYLPTQSEQSRDSADDLDALSEAIQQILQDDPNVDLDRIYGLAGSSGGARPKAHIKIDGEEWIVKFACRIDPETIGEEEYKANRKARECGINVSEFRLFPSNQCLGYFGTKRFDRTTEGRVHVISLAAMLETTHRLPNLDYGHLMQVVENVCADQSDLYEVFRRMCFNVFYENKDDHGKNFAFIYDENEHGYRLSPAYDLTKTANKYEHEMTVNGNGNPTQEDIKALANDFNLSRKKCAEILQDIRKRCMGK